jgi:hypothetical protein
VPVQLKYISRIALRSRHYTIGRIYSEYTFYINYRTLRCRKNLRGRIDPQQFAVNQTGQIGKEENVMSVFGPPLMDAGELVRTLATRVCETLTHESTDRDWTTAVMSALRALGMEKGCGVSPDKDEGAFLLDLIWWKNAELNDIALAVESEWGSNNAVWHDFGKLLVIKAPIKLMIYGTGSHEKESGVVRTGIPAP